MFEIAAHRGGNSWSGISKAIHKGYDYIELDVHRSKDGEIIVQYSPIVNIGNENIPVSDLMFNSLSDEEKERLMLLQDILQYTRDQIGVVIDIKKGSNFYPEIGKKIAELIQNTRSYSTVWIISFDHQCLVEAKNYDPNVKIAPMYVARPHNEEDYWKSVLADGVEICNDYLTRDSVELAHKNNMKLLGWCTEKMNEIQRLVELGVDIITIELDDCYFDFLRSMERNHK